MYLFLFVFSLSYLCFFVFQTNRSLGAAFKQWQAFVDEAKEEQALMNRAVRRFYNATLARAMAEWTEFTETCRKMKQAGRKWRAMAVSRAFLQWVAFADSEKQLKEKMRRIALRAQNSELSAALEQWKTAVTAYKRFRELSSRILSRMRYREAAVTLGAWIEYTERRQFSRDQKKAADEHRSSFSLRKAVETMRAFVDVATADKRKRQAALAKWINRSVSQCFDALAGYWSTKKRSREVRFSCKPILLKARDALSSALSLLPLVFIYCHSTLQLVFKFV